jgi:hypothetical protein
MMLLLFPGLSNAKGVKVENISLVPLTSSKVILKVSTPSGEKTYTHAQIEAVGLKKMTTSTYWPEDYGEFDGVLLMDLLLDAGIEDAPEVKITALDDYTAHIPQHDWRNWDVLLATRHEQKRMPIRSKGPLRIIYPKDRGGEVGESDMRLRWIWAIQSIEPVYQAN